MNGQTLGPKILEGFKPPSGPPHHSSMCKIYSFLSSFAMKHERADRAYWEEGYALNHELLDGSGSALDASHCVSAFVRASRRAFLAGRMLRLLRLIAPRV